MIDFMRSSSDMFLSLTFRRVTSLLQQQQHSLSTSSVYLKSKNTGGSATKTSKRLLSDADMMAASADWSSLKNNYDKLLVELRELYAKQIQLRTSSLAFEELTVTLPPSNKTHQLKELTQIIQKSPQMFMIDMARHAQYIPHVLDAIQRSGLNVNPQQDGTTLYLPTPKVTREHREELSKNAKKIADQIIVKMRDAYSKAHRNLKKQEKTMSQDLIADLDNNLKNRLDIYIAQVDKIRVDKQKSLLDTNLSTK
jgi:ribosome recycling factor